MQYGSLLGALDEMRPGAFGSFTASQSLVARLSSRDCWPHERLQLAVQMYPTLSKCPENAIRVITFTKAIMLLTQSEGLWFIVVE